MESFVTTFHIDWKIIIAQAINFIIVLVILYFLALKPLKKIMSERQSRIEGGLEDAKRNAKILADTKKEYDAIVVQAKTEAHEIFQEGKRDAEAKKTEMLEQAKVDVDRMIADGKNALEGEKAKMIEEAKKEIITLVVAATEKLLEDKADASFDQKQVKNIRNA
ncbi:MAG: F0F1 ATP synthase subunit B [Patescibacteria group bacterium]